MRCCTPVPSRSNPRPRISEARARHAPRRAPGPERELVRLLAPLWAIHASEPDRSPLPLHTPRREPRMPAQTVGPFASPAAVTRYLSQDRADAANARCDVLQDRTGTPLY